MSAINCWEVKKCGFEKVTPGEKTCPAVAFDAADGFLGGKNGGRACTFIPGTLCGGDGPCSTTDKTERCQQCKFFYDLKESYGAIFTPGNFHRFVQNSFVRAVL
ncbi:MAG: hypothetical protein HQL74_04640 [Magnetococcales bacterium]|nr:hypothetical protein [Magnetococcales bacterium]